MRQYPVDRMILHSCCLDWQDAFEVIFSIFEFEFAFAGVRCGRLVSVQ